MVSSRLGLNTLIGFSPEMKGTHYFFILIN